MDLGSLELQIFVSLTVVLGGAFVALVCDYLKGNNEQLREHNIELRVRKEEQERRMLLDPAGMLGQWLPGRKAPPVAAPAPAASHVSTPVGVHETMQSFADPEALDEVAMRALELQSRTAGDLPDAMEVPPLYAHQNRRKRPRRTVDRHEAHVSDWVSPEVMARVAMRAEARTAEQSDIREDLAATRSGSREEPANAPDSWDIREELRARSNREAKPLSGPATAAPAPESDLELKDAGKLQREIERVAQLERRPVEPPPGTILRPLTVPALKLEEELQRVVESAETSPDKTPTPRTPVAPNPWGGSLLEEVIAASAKPGEYRERFPAPVETGSDHTEILQKQADPVLPLQAALRVTRVAMPPAIQVPPLVVPVPAATTADAPITAVTPVEELPEVEFALDAVNRSRAIRRAREPVPPRSPKFPRM
jgi:hypothetical protein